MRVIGLTRVRNESLIIEDTLRHLLAYCDEVVLYDDASTDDTVALASEVGDAVTVLRGSHWLADRQAEETRHRRLLLEAGRRRGADWFLYLDADERLDRDPRPYMAELAGVDGLRFGLFDAYLTQGLAAPYESGPLEDLPRLFGPEERRILMAWRNGRRLSYLGRDQREPVASLRATVLDVDVRVKHYGKALSVEHWEETCRYYIDHFPEPYRSRWQARVGQALHDRSDAGAELSAWEDLPPFRPLAPTRENWKHLARRLQATLPRFRP